jgi:hypothetical protein
MSQFQRSLGELPVEVIHANSPQAKGRIERLFGTFQDRLVKEMRLEKIASIEEANRFLEGYLPIYNKRFAVLPAKPGTFIGLLPTEEIWIGFFASRASGHSERIGPSATRESCIRLKRTCGQRRSVCRSDWTGRCI